VDFDNCACSGKSLARLLQPALMSVLAGEPLHGYLIAQRLRKLSLFKDSPPDYAGIYRFLNSMEEQGLVKSEWDTADAGPAKRRYGLTRKGRSCMARWLATLTDYRQAIDDLVGQLGRQLAKKRPSR